VRRIRRHRRAVFALVLGGSLAAALTWGAAGLLAQVEPVPFTVNTQLPHWLAPGGRLVVSGTVGPAEAVTLLVGTRRQTMAAGPDGKFRFAVRAPVYEGLYKIAVEVARDPVERLELGFVRVRPLKLALAGDVNLGDRVATAISAFGVRYPWLSVAPVLRAADISIVNLECSVSTRGSPVPGKQFTFRGSPNSLRAMARFAGVDVVTVANNHALDYGRIAFADTLRYAHLYGMKTIGGGANLAVARRAAIFRLGGLRVALLGYSDVRPPGFDAGSTWSGTAPAFPWYIAPDVRRERVRGADIVVVYFHWGIERTFRPTARQRSLAQVAFDAGATIVVGAHPHVQQPMEQPRPRRLVKWSLGNFVFGANTLGTESTGILRVRVGRAGVRAYGFRRARIGGVYGIQPQLL
jgi:poly-gamma-glutamate capsule biosynthesis protein CapA/YwtB (metallophosphatase superfamily)